MIEIPLYMTFLSKVQLVPLSIAGTEGLADLVGNIAVSDHGLRGVRKKASALRDAGHMRIPLEHAVLIWIHFSHNRFIYDTRLECVGEHRCIRAACVHALLSPKVHLCSKHAVTLTRHFICLAKLLEHIALFIQNVLLLILLIVALESLFLMKLCLAIFSLKSLPEFGIMRVTFPLLSQLFDIFIK